MSLAAPWHCGAFEFALDEPLVMGIVNVTPDSFSDGGEHADTRSAVAHALVLVDQGAGMIDVGGESTRPGSGEVDAAQEQRRVVPVIEELAARGVPVSVDTRHAAVAVAAVAAGACVINDVSGFRDPDMVIAAGSCDAGLVVMHMLGDPRSMQESPHYGDVVGEVRDYLLRQARMLVDEGVSSARICVDPGIGFGKTLEHNLALIAGLDSLVDAGYPVLIGASRKRFVGEITHVDVPAQRVSGSVAAACESVRRGAHIVRVHDVAQTVQALAVMRAIGRSGAASAR